jgi:hypothetical protein
MSRLGCRTGTRHAGYFRATNVPRLPNDAMPQSAEPIRGGISLDCHAKYDHA